MKISVQKVIGDMGEVWQIEHQIHTDVFKQKDPVAAIKGQIKDVLRVADDRLYDINIRLIEHNKLAQGLTPEALLAVRQCVQVMYGQRGGVEQLPEKPPVRDDDATQGRVDKVVSALEGALEAVDEGGR